MSAHAEAHAAHPPAAHQSSRVDARTLGMFLFIASEIMLFGSFFAAYFFVRVANGTPWPTPAYELPVFVAGVNTLILVTSSFTMHWALQAIKRGNRAGPEGRPVAHVPARPHVPADAAARVLARRLRAVHGRVRHGLLLPHRPARGARLRRADAPADGDGSLLPRPLLARRSTSASRSPGSTGTSSTSCGSSSTRRSTSSRTHDQPAPERSGSVPVPAGRGRLLRR